MSALKLFSLSRENLGERIPPAFAHGSANHLVLALRSREQLREMHYDLSAGEALMLANSFTCEILSHRVEFTKTQ
jgi:predicted PhzF superfamily epimerase YddE/YHI9